MNRVLQFLKSKSMPFMIVGAVYVMFYVYSTKVHAFNNNNGRNLPFCDTTMTPSWDPPGIWYEWCGRRWFVPESGPRKAARTSYQPSRTFYQKKNRQERLAQANHAAITRMIQDFSRQRALKSAHQSSTMEVTYEDMKKAYAYGSDFLEYYAFPENIVMDMGVEDFDLTKPQHWKIPAGLKFSTLDRKIIDPKATVHADSVPEATHCIYVKSPNRGIDVYEYYLLDKDGLWSVGQNADDLHYSDYTDEEIMPLPLDVSTAFHSGAGEDTTDFFDITLYDDNEYGVDLWYYISEAFGTLETVDDGTIEVIKIAYQWWWWDYKINENPKLADVAVDSANGTEIYFYGKDGHQLMISTDSKGAETTGPVKPDYIYYQKVRKPGTSVAANNSMTAPKFSFFPNPTRGMVHFNSPTSFDVLDVLGRRVFRRHNATQADLSHLPRGMYFIRPQKGKAQKLLIQR